MRQLKAGVAREGRKRKKAFFRLAGVRRKKSSRRKAPVRVRRASSSFSAAGGKNILKVKVVDTAALVLTIPWGSLNPEHRLHTGRSCGQAWQEGGRWRGKEEMGGEGRNTGTSLLGSGS